MHHGYGNLDKAILLLEQEDRNDFNDYVKTNILFNPHIMFVSKKEIINKWFSALFPWLERCEKNLALKTLKVTIGEESMRTLQKDIYHFGLKIYKF